MSSRKRSRNEQTEKAAAVAATITAEDLNNLKAYGTCTKTTAGIWAGFLVCHQQEHQCVISAIMAKATTTTISTATSAAILTILSSSNDNKLFQKNCNRTATIISGAIAAAAMISGSICSSSNNYFSSGSSTSCSRSRKKSNKFLDTTPLYQFFSLMSLTILTSPH